MYQYMYIYWCNYTDLQHLIPMFLNNLNSLIRKFCIISDFIHINSHQYDWICQMWRNRNSWPTAGKPHKLTAIWSRHSTRTNGIATTERQPPFLHQQRVISSSWATMPWKRKHSWRVSQVTEKTMNNSFSLSCPCRFPVLVAIKRPFFHNFPSHLGMQMSLNWQQPSTTPV